jgi:hypothetical protein
VTTATYTYSYGTSSTIGGPLNLGTVQTVNATLRDADGDSGDGVTSVGDPIEYITSTGTVVPATLVGLTVDGDPIINTGGPTSFVLSNNPSLDSTTPGSTDAGVYAFPCFVSGTRIATARGEVAVEDLRIGDLVLTMQGGAALQPIRWIGHTRVDVTRQPDRSKAALILIKAGALDDGVPYRDLRVSPEHAMLLEGHLVPARLLVNGSTIVQEVWCQAVTYWHVELESHGLLVSDGAISESYFDDGNRKHFDNHAVTTLVKDFASERANNRYAEHACRPVLEAGPVLQRIHLHLARLAAEAEAAERHTA